jgi:hypothetical protein
MLVAHHVLRIDKPGLERGFKGTLHGEVVAGVADDPYQYKMWTVSWAIEALRRATRAPIEAFLYLNTGLSIVALVFAHHFWLRSTFSSRTALAGAFVLAALGNVLFASYWHQPQDLWGVALFCVLIAAVEDGRGIGILCALAFACGLVWDKHFLVPVLWTVLALRRRTPPLRAVLSGAAFLACALAVPVAVRMALHADRERVDDTGLSEQMWGWVAFQQLPWIVPFVALLFVARRNLSPWVRLLWLHLPALPLAYVAARFVLHEPRSFWPLAPVFTATFCAWLDRGRTS